MSHLTHVVPGEPFKPAAGDWNAFVDTARTVRDQRRIFAQETQAYSNQPELFIALQDFGTQAGGIAEVCVNTRDAAVGLAAHLYYQPTLGYLPGQKLAYMRDEGEVVCCWQPSETGCNTTRTEIRCGQYFWAIWNGQSGRWEAVSNGRNDSDSINDDANCPCKWWGFAIWEVQLVAAVKTWVLIDNRCSGCYHDVTPERAEITASLRFLTLGVNDDLVETPTANVDAFEEGDRYVTCCGVADDDPPPPPCELTCCYSVPVPLPSCDDPTSVSQVILRAVTGNATCSWASGVLSYTVWDDTWPESEHGCPDSNPDVTYTITMKLQSVVMSYPTITYTFLLLSTFNNHGWVVVTYHLDAEQDCTNDPTATKSAFQTNVNNLDSCTFCERDMAWLSSLFPTSITATRITCDETTTTNTSTSSSSTTGTTSTTTASTTTASTTTASTTTASTTTSSTTTASTTTGSTTTGSTTTGSTTTEACSSSSCTYQWDGALWNLTAFCANGGCACDSPGFSGSFVGQFAFTTCRNP